VVNTLRQWRSWVLVALLVAPVLAYVGLGMLWLWERGWIVCTIAAVVWVVAGVASRGPLDQDVAFLDAAARLGCTADIFASRP
jgi:hypothetical protein